MQKLILVINSGSTSLKYKLFEIVANKCELKANKRRHLREIKKGYIENIGQRGSAKNHYEALKLALKQLATNRKQKAESRKQKAILAIGHRVVHGGEEFIRPTLITRKNIKKLEKYNGLAPLHNPANLMGIKAALNLLPGIPNIACFDTAFYQTIKDKAFLYAIPKKYYKKYKIRRFGFHGISHQYVVEKVQSLKLKVQSRNSKLKVISCHLGGGCSITASIGGKAVDTSMGFTPLEGLMMMTRSGDIDPSIPLFLEKKEKISLEKVDKILNFESGIYGICGEKNWLEVIERMREGDKLARLAFDMFCYRIKKYIGAYCAILGGLDILIFTGTIGAGKSITRRTICRGLPFLKGVKVLAIPTNEELMIAGEVLRKLKI